MREEMTWNKHTITTTIIFVTLLILFFVPWRSDIQLPAVFRADVDQKIYAPAPGRVDEILVKKGQSVKKGETLIRFAAPDTYFRKRQADARVKSLQHDLDRQSSNERTIENVRVLATQLAEAQAESRGYNEELQQLDIKAPFDGIVEDLYDKLRPNIWLNPEQLLAIIVQPSVGAIEAYITEDDLKVVNSLTENKAENTKGVFYADNLEGSFDVRTQSIASANTSVLLSPYLASQHGGGVAVRPDKKDGMVPEKTIYRMVMMPAKPMASPERVTRGYIQLSGKRYSVAGRLVRLVAKVLIQESGF
jgi:putative peptide zinc metalloprotease protein